MKVGFHAKGSKYDCKVKGISDDAVTKSHNDKAK